MTPKNDCSIGWYRVPDRPRLHRYWNGERWIEPWDDEYPARIAVRDQPPRQRTGRSSAERRPED